MPIDALNRRLRRPRMPTLSTLLLFVVAVLGLMVSPGPNMALVVSQSLAHGTRGGIVSAAGIFAADLIMTLLVGAGVAAAVSMWPPAFDLLRHAGAAYLIWLALQAIRRSPSALPQQKTRSSVHCTFGNATLVSLLNPKALLFFLVFLPPFVDPRQGNVTVQLLMLGLVLSTVAFVFHALLGMFAGHAATYFSAGAARARWAGRIQACVLIGLAVRLLFLERDVST